MKNRKLITCTGLAGETNHQKKIPIFFVIFGNFNIGGGPVSQLIKKGLSNNLSMRECLRFCANEFLSLLPPDWEVASQLSCNVTNQ
jgi:hypothetical protein